MGFTPFSIDETITQTDPGRPHVPEGYYLVECVAVVPTAEDYDKTPGFYYDLKIVEGAAGVGRTMRSYATWKPEAQFSNARYLGAFGVAEVARKMAGTKIPDYKTFAALASGISKMISGKRAVALIGDQQNNGRVFSGVEEMLPADDWKTLRESTVTLTPRANGSGATTPAQTQGTQAPVSVPDLEATISSLFA